MKWREKLKKIEYSNLYPLFFTIIFILILIQYSFNSLDAIFYDFWIKYDFNSRPQTSVVIVTLDEESDQFLGENFPYTYANHKRLMERVLRDGPSVVGYLMTLPEPDSLQEQKYLEQFKYLVSMFQQENKGFRFGTEIEGIFGEILPPDPLKTLGFSPAFLFVDSTSFAKDEVIRRGVLSISGEDSFHLWVANKHKELMQKETRSAANYQGYVYNPEADATFVQFKYHFSPVDYHSVTMIPFHRVVGGNYSEDFFKNKIVLIGPQYISNVGDFSYTPFNKDELKGSKLIIHANIVAALLEGNTIWAVDDIFSKILSILLAVFLSFIISRVQPTKGLMITIAVMLGTFVVAYFLFGVFGWWIKLSHIILSIFVVYYIWVPFRAIEEYQTRYAIQEETKLLKKVDNLKQNFISLMSHDLKTPVAKIAGIADILKIQYPNSQDQNKLIDNIIQSTKELNNFINSILDLTKIESQNLIIKKESKDVNKIIEGIVEKLKFEANLQEIKIETNLAPLYPVEVDVVLMNRVFSNLVENAIKYSGKGSVIDIETWDDKDWVYVSIKDNGVGIKKEDLPHIFDKFYRVKNDSTHVIKGSGLGLYLVKYFIELHNGTIEATSEIGKGTKFTVKLKNQ